MGASKKQVELIEQLMGRGAAIPSKDGGDPDWSMYKSVAEADAYIKQWGHLMARGRTSMSAADYGGIPNC